MVMTKLAPVSKSARRIAEKQLRRRVTDREVVRMFPGCECREIPTRLAILDRLMVEAWDMVHRLTGSGVTFAGDARQATLVIAGTAYAGWRSSIGRPGRGRDPEAAAVVVAAMKDGIEFALCHKAGIPVMYATDYARAIAGSDDPVDRMKPLAALARLWPDRYTTTSLRFRRPKYESGDGGAADQWWGMAPNVVTASRGELRRAAKAAT